VTVYINMIVAPSILSLLLFMKYCTVMESFLCPADRFQFRVTRRLNPLRKNQLRTVRC